MPLNADPALVEGSLLCGLFCSAVAVLTKEEDEFEVGVDLV